MHVHRQHLEAAAEIGVLTYVVHLDYSGCALPRDPRAVVRKARESGARVILEVFDEAAIVESVAYLERRGIVSPV